MYHYIKDQLFAKHFAKSKAFPGARPNFSPTKFFAGRDTGHEAVVFYRSLRYLQMPGNEAAAEKSFGPKG
jgi:hypothetical protein